MNSDFIQDHLYKDRTHKSAITVCAVLDDVNLHVLFVLKQKVLPCGRTKNLLSVSFKL